MTLETLAEKSQFRLTGRLDEVEALCAAFAGRWPEAVRSFVYGQSAEGRSMRALLISRSGAFTPRRCVHGASRCCWSKPVSTLARATVRTPASSHCASCSAASHWRG
ncbi:hypothetical protein ACFQ0B_79460 [Nonomuraea thailandensis]